MNSRTRREGGRPRGVPRKQQLIGRSVSSLGALSLQLIMAISLITGGVSGKTSSDTLARGSSLAIESAYFDLPPLVESSVLTLVDPDDSKSSSNSTSKPSSRVAYGQDAQPGQWPYIGLTLIRMASGSTAQCASTKISARVALTAAHCLANTGGISDISAAYGIVTQSQFSGKRVPAYQYSYPDNYDDQQFSNDIGLIAFENEIPNTPTVALSQVPNSQLAGTPLYVAGWGLTETQYLNGQMQVSEVLKYAQVPYMSQPECQQVYSSIGLIGPPTTHFCAGGIKADACMGDSGGPLSIEAAAYPTPGYDTNIQVGVVSHGPVPCGGPNNIGAYTDVNQYLRWINDEIWYNNWEGTSVPAVKNAVSGPTCYSGAVVAQTTTGSGGECCQQCKENPNCGSWNYNAGQCVQHAMGGFQKTGGVCASGWLDRSGLPSGAQTETGFFEYPGATMVVNTLAVSAGGCAVACENQGGCKYFTYIGPIGGSNKYNSAGANCQLASADGQRTPSTTFVNAVSGVVDADTPLSPVPPEEPPVPDTPSPPPPRPTPSPDYLQCKLKTGTYVLRNAGTSCSAKYMTTNTSNCRSTSVKMSRSTYKTAGRFVVRSTSSGTTLTAVKSCSGRNKRLNVSSKNSRSNIASLSKWPSTFRLLSWDGKDCTVVGIQSIARASRGYSSFLSRSGSCSNNSVFVASTPAPETSAWQLIYLSSSTMTRRKC